ncbi:MAG TPA: thioredoxin domain-containing protein [Blastocatellia bacterium]|nr:thioredoxin domain-containing protein [Blastocatellia bacterium]
MKKIVSSILMLLLSGAISGPANAQAVRPGPDTAAVIGGKRAITQREVDESIESQLFALEEKLYALRRNALENLITRILLEEEAARNGVTVDEIKRRLMPDRVEISRSQIDMIYGETAESLGGMSEDEARQRIKLDLEGRERIERYRRAIQELRSRAEVDIRLVAPVAPSIKVTPEGPSIGPADAAVTIIIFSDFECPYCKQASAVLREVIESYPQQVRVVFKQMPLPIHPNALKAAEASLCALRQGKFWEYHDRLFNSTDISGGNLLRYAAETGLSTTLFRACLDSSETRETVLKDMQEARRANVQGTPTFIINGRLLRGVTSLENFKSAIDDELKRRAQSRGSRPTGGG